MLIVSDSNTQNSTRYDIKLHFKATVTDSLFFVILFQITMCKNVYKFSTNLSI